MTINQVIGLDCREEKNYEIVQKYLKKIKPLSKYKDIEDVPIYKIEKVIKILSKKYNMRVRDISPDIWSNDEEVIWNITLIDDGNLHICGIIYGLSLYEVLAKAAIYMYDIKNKIGKRKVK